MIFLSVQDVIDLHAEQIAAYGLAAALVFLDLNGAEVSSTSEQAAEITTGVAASAIDKAQLTEELRRCIATATRLE